MARTRSSNRRSLVIPGAVYFGSVFVVGLPVMYAVYVILAGILSAVHLDWFVASAGGITVVALSFLIGMRFAGQVAARLINSWSQTI